MFLVVDYIYLAYLSYYVESPLSIFTMPQGTSVAAWPPSFIGPSYFPSWDGRVEDLWTQCTMRRLGSFEAQYEKLKLTNLCIVHNVQCRYNMAFHQSGWDENQDWFINPSAFCGRHPKWGRQVKTKGIFVLIGWQCEGLQALLDWYTGLGDNFAPLDVLFTNPTVTNIHASRTVMAQYMLSRSGRFRRVRSSQC